MGYLSLVLLFSKTQSSEPAAILQCGTSGEYFPFYFVDWREGVHYLFWCDSNGSNPREHDSFDTWGSAYGYDEEEFIGNLDEFVGSDCLDPFVVFTSIGDIKPQMVLSKLSAWNDSVKQDDEEQDDEEQDNEEQDE
jgi:hypothetical protein